MNLKNPWHFKNDKYTVNTWFERDRQHVALENETNGETVIEWWDEDVHQAIEDGFLNPKDWLGSALVYARSHNLIADQNRAEKKVTNPARKKLSKEAQHRVSKKIAILRREGYSAEQAAAIAYKFERAGKLGPRGGKKHNPSQSDDEGIYLYFIVNALRGGNPVETDKFLRENLDTITEFADSIFEDLEQEIIYRGVIYKSPQKYYRPHKNFTYISCTENREIAENFADPTPEGFGSLISLGDYGYVVEIEPPYNILFHYFLFDDHKLGPLLKKYLGDVSSLKAQQEVMILQPQRQIPMKLYKQKAVRSNPSKRMIDVGTRVEMEHTNSKREARAIALDHLKESPNYYSDWKNKEKILGMKKVNPNFPIKWTTDKTGKIHRANLMDYLNTKIVVRQKADQTWTWEMLRTFKNGQVIDEGDVYESLDEAKSEALKFYDDTSRPQKSNPIEDQDVGECCEALEALNNGRDPEDFSEDVLDALESEGLWSYDSGVTKKGREFLENVGANI